MSTLEFESVSSRTRARRRPSRATSRGMSLAETVSLVLVGALLVIGVVTTSGRADAHIRTTRAFVKSGDTAWAIASKHPVPGLTTEQVAEQIERLNNVRGGLTVNTAIEIPDPGHSLSGLARR